MTAKQKANQARFKKVVAEAKKLRKKNPKLTQAQAVKQAWAISYSKSGTKKVGNVPISKFNEGDLVYSYQNKTYKAPIAYKKFVPWESLSKPNSKDKYVYKLKLKDGYSNYINEESLSKKSIGATPTKKAAKKSSSYHKDTKSHNVNIRVMSGTKDFSGKILDELNQTLNRISNAQEAIDKLKIGLKYKQYRKEDIPEARKRVKKYTEYMKGLKKHFRELKRQFS